MPTIGVGERITKNVLDNSINEYAKNLFSQHLGFRWVKGFYNKSDDGIEYYIPNKNLFF